MEIEKSLRDKKILVTGGAGFIGSNLCKFLLSCGSYVTCFDNFSTGKIKNISDFLDKRKFTLIEGDIRNLNTCQKVCKNQEFVLHQAALGSVPRSLIDPLTTNDVNIGGFLNMIIAARDNKVKKFIFAASSSTYGDSKDLPKVESNIGSPLSPYAITKYVNELYADIFKKYFGLDYIGLRYFNVFGKNQDPDGAYAAVIPIFIKKLMKNESPIINGDKFISRDFTYIDNVIKMNTLAMITNNEKANNQIYNVAVGEQTSLFELINMMKKHIKKHIPEIDKINPLIGPPRDGDILHSLADISKAKNLLGYKNITNINDGLRIYIDDIFDKN